MPRILILPLSLQFLLYIFLLTACTRREKIEILHEGRYTIKARFVNGKRNGKTEVYLNGGRLTGTINYVNDIEEGTCTHYFPNGAVKDSVNYANGNPMGYWRHYELEGDPRYIDYYYSGLKFGPELWYYKDWILKSFTFLNFERESIVECTYNTHGNLDSIEKLDLKVVLEDMDKEGSPMLKCFAYLPKIPLTVTSYSIGIADKNHVKQKLGDIEGSNFFIDTVLSAPPPGYHFYLRCDVKDSVDALIRTQVIEMIKTEDQPAVK